MGLASGSGLGLGLGSDGAKAVTDLRSPAHNPEPSIAFLFSMTYLLIYDLL